MSFEERFLALRDELPPPVQPPDSVRYRYWRRAGGLLFSSGHGPRWGNAFKYTGKIGRDLTIDEGYAAARLTALNLMQTIRQAQGTLDHVRQFIDVFGAVNSAPGMTEQPRVMNGFSDCIYEIFGDASAPPMLLIMGLGAQMVLWDDGFCEQLATRGFRVIRFDNRDIGKSSKLNEPSFLVTVESSRLVAIARAFTVAPGRTAPLLSVTVS